MPALASRDALTLDASALRKTLGESLPDETLDALSTLARSFVDSPRATILPSMIPGALPAASEDGAPPIIFHGTLGQGGMGIVRRATQRSLGREVAVKTLKPGFEGDARAAAQLMREAWITGLLEHPNIVPVHDIRFGENRTPIVVLKRIEGDGWDELLAEPERIHDRLHARDPLGWHLRVLIHVCHAVELAHDRGVAHRDLKPENVMIGRFGEVYLVDWGVAAALREDTDPRVPRATPAIVGTPAYMAPEMARGAAELIGEHTDVYLLGAILFELLAGRPPHEGSSILEIVTSVLLSDPELPEEAPTELAAICRRAMSRAPADRHASVAELRAALEDHLAHRASVRLAQDAEARLDELEKRAAALGDDPVERGELQELFGQCRFGFVHALSTWPGNAKARVGLDRALVAVARSELARGQAGAARTVLAEAESVPDELRDAIEAALGKEEQERAVLEELERQRREMDPSVGRAQRALFSAVLGSSVCFGPLIAIARERMGNPQQDSEVLFWPWVMCAFVSVVSWLFRRALLRTALNRRLMGMLVGSMAALGLFHIGARQAGLDLPTIQALDFALFSGVAATLAILVDRRLSFTSALFLLGFFLATAHPDLRYWLLFVANLGLIANFLWLWPPWRREASDPPDGPAPS